MKINEAGDTNQMKDAKKPDQLNEVCERNIGSDTER